ncbi:MAG: hypothetical protein ACI3YZ_01010, partial [Prevotella sp.]
IELLRRITMRSDSIFNFQCENGIFGGEIEWNSEVLCRFVWRKEIKVVSLQRFIYIVKKINLS